MRNPIVQSSCMFAISTASIVALIITICDAGNVNAPAFYVLWSISTVYFLADSVYLLGVERPVDTLIVAHHLVALAALVFMFVFVQFRIFMIVIGLQEISTFFLFIKRIDAMRQWKSEVEFAFIAAWILFRVVLSPLLAAWAIVVFKENVSVAAGFHVAFHTFYLMCNVYWTIEIVMSKWRKRSRAVENDVA